MTTLISYGAMFQSLAAEERAMDKTALNPSDVATVVGLEAGQRIQREAEQAATAEEHAANVKLKKASLLGCWINGKLRFQSRDHDAIYDYANKHMNGAKNFGNDVWVAPVGSFVA